MHGSKCRLRVVCRSGKKLHIHLLTPGIHAPIACAHQFVPTMEITGAATSAGHRAPRVQLDAVKASTKAWARFCMVYCILMAGVAVMSCVSYIHAVITLDTGTRDLVNATVTTSALNLRATTEDWASSAHSMLRQTARFIATAQDTAELGPADRCTGVSCNATGAAHAAGALRAAHLSLAAHLDHSADAVWIEVLDERAGLSLGAARQADAPGSSDTLGILASSGRWNATHNPHQAAWLAYPASARGQPVDQAGCNALACAGAARYPAWIQAAAAHGRAVLTLPYTPSPVVAARRAAARNSNLRARGMASVSMAPAPAPADAAPAGGIPAAVQELCTVLNAVASLNFAHSSAYAQARAELEAGQTSASRRGWWATAADAGAAFGSSAPASSRSASIHDTPPLIWDMRHAICPHERAQVAARVSAPFAEAQAVQAGAGAIAKGQVGAWILAYAGAEHLPVTDDVHGQATLASAVAAAVRTSSMARARILQRTSAYHAQLAAWLQAANSSASAAAAAQAGLVIAASALEEAAVALTANISQPVQAASARSLTAAAAVHIPVGVQSAGEVRWSGGPALRFASPLLAALVAAAGGQSLRTPHGAAISHTWVRAGAAAVQAAASAAGLPGLALQGEAEVLGIVVALQLPAATLDTGIARVNVCLEMPAPAGVAACLATLQQQTDSGAMVSRYWLAAVYPGSHAQAAAVYGASQVNVPDTMASLGSGQDTATACVAVASGSPSASAAYPNRAAQAVAATLHYSRALAANASVLSSASMPLPAHPWWYSGWAAVRGEAVQPAAQEYDFAHILQSSNKYQAVAQRFPRAASEQFGLRHASGGQTAWCVPGVLAQRALADRAARLSQALERHAAAKSGSLATAGHMLHVLSDAPVAQSPRWIRLPWLDVGQWQVATAPVGVHELIAVHGAAMWRDAWQSSTPGPVTQHSAVWSGGVPPALLTPSSPNWVVMLAVPRAGFSQALLVPLIVPAVLTLVAVMLVLVVQWRWNVQWRAQATAACSRVPSSPTGAAPLKLGASDQEDRPAVIVSNPMVMSRQDAGHQASPAGPAQPSAHSSSQSAGAGAAGGGSPSDSGGDDDDVTRATLITFVCTLVLAVLVYGMWLNAATSAAEQLHLGTTAAISTVQHMTLTRVARSHSAALEAGQASVALALRAMPESGYSGAAPAHLDALAWDLATNATAAQAWAAAQPDGEQVAPGVFELNRTWGGAQQPAPATRLPGFDRSVLPGAQPVAAAVDYARVELAWSALWDADMSLRDGQQPAIADWRRAGHTLSLNVAPGNPDLVQAYASMLARALRQAAVVGSLLDVTAAWHAARRPLHAGVGVAVPDLVCEASDACAVWEHVHVLPAQAGLPDAHPQCAARASALDGLGLPAAMYSATAPCALPAAHASVASVDYAGRSAQELSSIRAALAAGQPARSSSTPAFSQRTGLVAWAAAHSGGSTWPAGTPLSTLAAAAGHVQASTDQSRRSASITAASWEVPCVESARRMARASASWGSVTSPWSTVSTTSGTAADVQGAAWWQPMRAGDDVPPLVQGWLDGMNADSVCSTGQSIASATLQCPAPATEQVAGIHTAEDAARPAWTAAISALAWGEQHAMADNGWSTGLQGTLQLAAVQPGQLPTTCAANTSRACWTASWASIAQATSALRTGLEVVRATSPAKGHERVTASLIWARGSCLHPSARTVRVNTSADPDTLRAQLQAAMLPPAPAQYCWQLAAAQVAAKSPLVALSFFQRANMARLQSNVVATSRAWNNHHFAGLEAGFLLDALLSPPVPSVAHSGMSSAALSADLASIGVALGSHAANAFAAPDAVMCWELLGGGCSIAEQGEWMPSTDSATLRRYNALSQLSPAAAGVLAAGDSIHARAVVGSAGVAAAAATRIPGSMPVMGGADATRAVVVQGVARLQESFARGTAPFSYVMARSAAVSAGVLERMLAMGGARGSGVAGLKVSAAASAGVASGYSARALANAANFTQAALYARQAAGGGPVVAASQGNDALTRSVADLASATDTESTSLQLRTHWLTGIGLRASQLLTFWPFSDSGSAQAHGSVRSTQEQEPGAAQFDYLVIPPALLFAADRGRLLHLDAQTGDAHPASPGDSGDVYIDGLASVFSLPQYAGNQTLASTATGSFALSRRGAWPLSARAGMGPRRVLVRGLAMPGSVPSSQVHAVGLELAHLWHVARRYPDVAYAVQHGTDRPAVRASDGQLVDAATAARGVADPQHVTNMASIIWGWGESAAAALHAEAWAGCGEALQLQLFTVVQEAALEGVGPTWNNLAFVIVVGLVIFMLGAAVVAARAKPAPAAAMPQHVPSIAQGAGAATSPKKHERVSSMASAAAARKRRKSRAPSADLSSGSGGAAGTALQSGSPAARSSATSALRLSAAVRQVMQQRHGSMLSPGQAGQSPLAAVSLASPLSALTAPTPAASSPSQGPAVSVKDLAGGKWPNADAALYRAHALLRPLVARLEVLANPPTKSGGSLSQPSLMAAMAEQFRRARQYAQLFASTSHPLEVLHAECQGRWTAAAVLRVQGSARWQLVVYGAIAVLLALAFGEGGRVNGITSWQASHSAGTWDDSSVLITPAGTTSLADVQPLSTLFSSSSAAMVQAAQSSTVQGGMGGMVTVGGAAAGPAGSLQLAAAQRAMGVVGVADASEGNVAALPLGAQLLRMYQQGAGTGMHTLQLLESGSGMISSGAQDSASSSGWAGWRLLGSFGWSAGEAQVLRNASGAPSLVAAGASAALPYVSTADLPAGFQNGTRVVPVKTSLDSMWMRAGLLRVEALCLAALALDVYLQLFAKGCRRGYLAALEEEDQRMQAHAGEAGPGASANAAVPAGTAARGKQKKRKPGGSLGRPLLVVRCVLVHAMALDWLVRLLLGYTSGYTATMLPVSVLIRPAYAAIRIRSIRAASLSFISTLLRARRVLLLLLSFVTLAACFMQALLLGRQDLHVPLFANAAGSESDSSASADELLGNTSATGQALRSGVAGLRLPEAGTSAASALRREPDALGQGFGSIDAAFLTMTIYLLTGENYEDVTYPTSDNSPGAGGSAALAFKPVFMIMSFVGLFIFTSLLIATFRDQYGRVEAQQAQELLHRKRLAALVAFCMLDEDGSGTLERDEYAAFFRSSGVREEHWTRLPALLQPPEFVYLAEWLMEHQAFNFETGRYAQTMTGLAASLARRVGAAQAAAGSVRFQATRQVLRRFFNDETSGVRFSSLVQLVLLLHVWLVALLGTRSAMLAYTILPVFPLLYLVEIVLRVLAAGWTRFWNGNVLTRAKSTAVDRAIRRIANRFDVVVIALSALCLAISLTASGSEATVSLAEAVQLPAPSHSQTMLRQVGVVLPLTRLFSVVKATRVIVFGLLSQAKLFGHVMALLLLVTYWFAALGTWLFAGALSALPASVYNVRAANFDTLEDSASTLYQVMTAEGFDNILYACVAATHSLYPVLYFLSFVVLVTLLFANLLVSMVCDTYVLSQQHEQQDRRKAPASGPTAAGAGTGAAGIFGEDDAAMEQFLSAFGDFIQAAEGQHVPAAASPVPRADRTPPPPPPT